jgi:hypothetical protein
MGGFAGQTLALRTLTRALGFPALRFRPQDRRPAVRPVLPRGDQRIDEPSPLAALIAQRADARNLAADYGRKGWILAKPRERFGRP